MTSMTTTMTFSYFMSSEISNERLLLQYSTFQCFRIIGGHLSFDMMGGEVFIDLVKELICVNTFDPGFDMSLEMRLEKSLLWS